MAVAVLASIFCKPNFPNIDTNAADTADSMANTSHDKSNHFLPSFPHSTVSTIKTIIPFLCIFFVRYLVVQEAILSVSGDDANGVHHDLFLHLIKSPNEFNRRRKFTLERV